MRKMRWQILIVVLALAAIGVLLLGQQPALLPVIQEVQPPTGGVYTEGLVGVFGRLNPVLDFYNPADRDIDRLIYSSLLRIDDRGSPVYDLVESMGISREGTAYNFSLREDATWHDGEPVTADDVVFTIELLRSEELPVPSDVRDLWNTVEAEALDDRTLQFRLPEPYAPFMDYLTFGILPRHLLGDLSPAEIVDAQFNLEPVGSGPYRFKGLLAEDDQVNGVILEANRDYYTEPPFIKEFVFRYFPDSTSANAAYESGEVLGVSEITNDVLPAALEAPNLNLYSSRLPRLAMIFLNLDNPEVPFFQDTSVRRALLKGLNRQGMINQLRDGQAIIADGPIFPGSWAYYDGVEHIAYDPEGAVQMLKGAGYTIPAAGGTTRANEEGQRLEFELLYPDEPAYQPLAEMIAENWRELGVDATLKPVSYEDLVSAYLEPRAYQAALVELNLSRYPDPDPYPFWHQAQITGGQNYAKWDDRQASEYLEQARVETDVAERARLYRNFQVRFSSELPALPLFYPVYNYAVDDDVQGITVGPLFDPSDRFSTVTQWFLPKAGGDNVETTPAEITPTP
jgi:peptide/nickel transport system substrate-binding protein